jgi:hypothetical protein
MKKFAMMAAVAAAAFVAVPAAAHAEWYAGAGYTQYEADDADSTGGVTGRLGYRLTPHFAVEGEGTAGVSDGDNASLNSAIGIYGVGTLPIGSSGFDVHGRVGYNQIDMDRDAAPDLDDGGLSYGAGVGWNVTSRVGLRADFTRTETDSADADAISLGGTINF